MRGLELYKICVGAWLSLVERTVRDREVAGSNPVAPTIFSSTPFLERGIPIRCRNISHPSSRGALADKRAALRLTRTKKTLPSQPSEEEL